MMEFLNKLKSTEKGKVLIRFSGYMLFLLFVVLFIMTTGSMDTETTKNNFLLESESQIESIKNLTYLEKQEKLLNEDHDFEYQISGETSLKYKGNVRNDIVTGYKQTSSQIIEYKIDSTGIYQIKLNESSTYTNLYTGLNEEYFDLKGLFSTINNLSAIIEKTENEKKYIYDTEENIKYIVITDMEAITEVIIEDSNLTYDFKFTY